jgi:TfoX N-terminal domain
MAWTKTPIENHELFRAALPRDPRIVQKKMFGCLVGMVHGRMYAATFGRSVFVRLSPEDREAALRLDGAEIWDPRGLGGERETIFLPEAIMDERDELCDWLQRGLAYSVTLPIKKAARTAKKSPAKKSPAKKTATPKKKRSA